MSCYSKSDPKQLNDAIKSTFITQVVKPDEFVIVLDGPVSEDILAVVEQYKEKYPAIFIVVKLIKNQGLGNALKHGFKYCTKEYVARMDADDISDTHRFKILKCYAEAHPTLSVIGSFTAEFKHNPENLLSIRTLKLNNEEIFKQSMHRSPVSHVSVLMKRADVEAVGGYQDFPYYEDYFLWIRMLRANYKFVNIPKVLVYVRTDDDRYVRKANRTYQESTRRFQYYLLKEKHIGLLSYCVNNIARLTVAKLPNKWRKAVYENLLRRKPGEITHEKESY